MVKHSSCDVPGCPGDGHLKKSERGLLKGLSVFNLHHLHPSPFWICSRNPTHNYFCKRNKISHRLGKSRVEDLLCRAAAASLISSASPPQAWKTFERLRCPMGAPQWPQNRHCLADIIPITIRVIIPLIIII